MSFPQLCEVVGDSVFWSAIVLWVAGFIGLKRLRFCGCVAFGMYTLKHAATGHYVLTTIDALFSYWYYWLWKNDKDDDDDRPRKRRAALRSKFDKVLPKPKVVPAPAL